MIRALHSLRVGGVILVIAAFVLGLVAASLWLGSDARWASHLKRARFAGAVLYDGLYTGLAPPQGVTLTPLSGADQDLAQKGQFEILSVAPRPALVTNLSIRRDHSALSSAPPLALAILSPDLRYPVSALSSRTEQPPSETLGAVTRLLATYCSDPVLIARPGDGAWIRIDAPISGAAPPRRATPACWRWVWRWSRSGCW